MSCHFISKTECLRGLNAFMSSLYCRTSRMVDHGTAEYRIILYCLYCAIGGRVCYKVDQLLILLCPSTRTQVLVGKSDFWDPSPFNMYWFLLLVSNLCSMVLPIALSYIVEITIGFLWHTQITYIHVSPWSLGRYKERHSHTLLNCDHKLNQEKWKFSFCHCSAPITVYWCHYQYNIMQCEEWQMNPKFQILEIWSL